MKTYETEIRGTKPGQYRAGEWALALGVVYVTPKQHPSDREPLAPRLCWFVEFPDGASDLWPMTEQYETRPANPVEWPALDLEPLL